MSTLLHGYRVVCPGCGITYVLLPRDLGPMETWLATSGGLEQCYGASAVHGMESVAFGSTGVCAFGETAVAYGHGPVPKVDDDQWRRVHDGIKTELRSIPFGKKVKLILLMTWNSFVTWLNSRLGG